VLKGDRAVYITDIRHICNVAAEQGVVMVLPSQSGGRGVSPGINDSAPVAAPGSGTPASGTRVLGILMDYVVNIDPTRQHRNFQRTEQLVGENVAILKDGWVRTNQVSGTPTAGDTAYLGSNGQIQNSQVNSIPAVGYFQTGKGTDGFAIVTIKVP
jgi:hypothetical protein